ncbi:MFS transporter [Actinomadura oligospora]|uniref:MFS transporter n=1 Tax=Actinomadura oligospora TaxID=111804 RepID=UPI0004AD3D57
MVPRSPGAATAGHAAAPARYSHRQILEILSGLMIAMLTTMISTSVVGTALPTIVGDLGGQDQLSWVASASLLTMTASTPLWGKLSDILGRKLMFQSALVIFVLASVGAGLSQNIGQLIGARALQGLGVGGVSALAQVILGDVVPPRERGRYSGYMGAVFGVATVAGPMLGGFIVDADGLGWRWCFYVCVPLAIIALAVMQKVLKLPKVKRDTRIDIFGAFTITGAATVVMLILTMGGKEFDWNSTWTYVLAAVAVVLLIGAVVAERAAREPILPPRLFRNPTFVLCSIASLAVGVAMFGAMIYLPQYLQIVKGMSPTGSGLMTLPMVAAMFVTSTGSGQIVTRLGRYKWFPVVGLALVASSMFLLSRLHVDSSKLVIGADIAVLGAGLGLTLQIMILAAQNAAAVTDLAATTSGVSFFRNLGGAIGTAAFGAILNNRLTHHLAEGLTAAHVRPPAGGTSLGTPDAVQHLPEPFKGIVLEAFTQSLQTVFLVGVPVAAVGFVVVLFLKELPLRGSSAISADKAPGASAAAPAPADAPASTSPNGRHARTGQELAAVGASTPSATALTSANGASVNGSSSNGSSVDGASAGGASASGASVAEVVPSSTEVGAGGGVTVKGVVRGGDGSPVESAALTLIDVSGRQLGRALTGADGGYALDTPGPGTYVLIAATGGHEPQAATLVVGDRPVEFDLVLAGNGGLAGTVSGADGTPLDAATVVVTDVRGEVVGTGRTGTNGEYQFQDVAAGSYTIAVSAAGHRPAALQVEVSGNGLTRQDVRLPAGVHVRGVVRDEAGLPVGRARVTLVDAAGNVAALSTTGPDGEYAFTDLTGGQYTVIASGYPPVATGLNLSGGSLDGHDLHLGHPEQ